jgi:hypothetical protein
MSSLFSLLVVGAVAYYFLVMRKGGGSVDYGLRPGEGVAAMYVATLFQKPGGTAWFPPIKDEQVTITWTTTGRLVVSSVRGSFAPVELEGAQAAVVGKVTQDGVALFGKDPQAQIAGPNGLEPMVVVEVKDQTHAPAQLLVAKSGAERLVAGSRGG